jgi:hypothetical protein
MRSRRSCSIDLGAVLVDEVRIDARHRTAREADPGACLDEVAKRDEPLAPHGRAAEIAHVEEQNLSIRIEHVVLVARIFAERREIPDGEVHRLLGAGRLSRENCGAKHE